MASVQPSVHAARTFGAIATMVAVLLVPFGTAGASDLRETANFDIPAEPLIAALLQFSTQAHIQVATSGSEVGRALSPGVTGSMSIEIALRSLLSGTGFTYQISGDRSVAIVPRSADATDHFEYRM